MNLTVIICTWNRAKMLVGTLESLAASVVPPGLEWEVLVVDNNSSDDTCSACRTFMEKLPGRFRYVFEGAQGKSFALNTGIENARGEILAFTDDDVTVDPNWITEIISMFQKYDCAGVAGRIVPRWTCPQPSWIEFDGPYHHPAFGAIGRFDKGDSPLRLNSTGFGANLAFKRAIIDKYGRYRPDLCRRGDLLGGEDTEYCRRILNGGEVLMYAPQAVVYHPVERHQAEKKYLQSFAYHYGRHSIRIGTIPLDAPCYFGVPRYFFPIALKFFMNWISSLNEKRRLFFKLELCYTLGQMVEGKRWLRDRRSQTAINGYNPAN